MKTPTKTPVEILADELERTGLEKTELGRKLGSRAPYLFVRDILQGRKAFDAALQARVADALGKPRNFFSDPEENERRNQHIRATFEAFLRTDIGQKIDAETRRSIEHIPFLGERLPTVGLYQAIALAMAGHLSPERAMNAVDLNDALDASPDPPDSKPKRRK